MSTDVYNCATCKHKEKYGGDVRSTVCMRCIDSTYQSPSNWEPVDHKVENKNYETNDQMVSHPNHYQTKSGLETIDVIEAFTDGLDGIEAVDTANVIKYICRWKKKNGLQDLKKAMWYLTHLINHVEKGE